MSMRMFALTVEPWMERAKCRAADPEVFYPDHSEGGRAAKGVCRSCPVVAQCLAYALRTSERHGVWGGMTYSERVNLGRRKPKG